MKVKVTFCSSHKNKMITPQDETHNSLLLAIRMWLLVVISSCRITKNVVAQWRQ